MLRPARHSTTQKKVKWSTRESRSRHLLSLQRLGLLPRCHRRRPWIGWGLRGRQSLGEKSIEVKALELLPKTISLLTPRFEVSLANARQPVH
jgi:hypothetical protein